MSSGFLGFFKRRPPDLKTLGKWLWNNDVDLLGQTQERANVTLFKELVESDVISVASGSVFSKTEADMVAGHLTNLVDGGYLFKDYEAKTKDGRLIDAAERTRDLILTGEYPELSALSVMVGALLAIRLWYALRFEECIKVASHVVSIANEKGGAEALRVRGFAFFALGDYAAAQADISEAQRREPGLVGINEPLKALAKLTNTPRPKDHEPAGVAKMRGTLQTLLRILRLAAVEAGSAEKSKTPLSDFAARAEQVEGMIKSNVLVREHLTAGDVADFAMCAMSAQIALTQYLLTSQRPGQGALPNAQEIREAFGYCSIYVAGTQSINPNVGPAFSEMVEGFNEAVESLFARLDESRFDL